MICKTNRGRLLRLRRGLCFLLALALPLIAAPAPPARAAGRGDVSLTASPEVILADGKSTTVITATVRDGSGNLAADGASVRFQTDRGTLDKDTVTTTAGAARITLTSAATDGTATVQATAFLPGAGGSSTGSTHVDFTSDRDALFTTGEARWIRIDCPQYLVYSADSKIVEAQGRKGSAHLAYRTLDITADSLQVDLQTQWLLATSATMQRARHLVRVAQLRYNLATGAGTAVILGADKRASESVTITGYSLEVAPQTDAAAQAALLTNIYRFMDISSSRVVVSARAINVDPGIKLQFRRASIYSDGKKLLSLPFHVMPLNTDQIFGQQIVGFGSQGLFLNIPYYYHVSPHSTGTIYLRNSAVSGATLNSLSAGSGMAYVGTRPGLALDLEHTYSLGSGGSGSLVINGLTRSDWGAHWNHTQKIDPSTNSYFYIDYPEHRGLYASSNLTRQFDGYSLNMSATANRDPGFDGYSSSGHTFSTYLQTPVSALGQTGINLVTSLSWQRGEYVQNVPNAARQVIPISTRGLDFRFFTAPIRPDRHSTLTDSLTVGQSWDGNSSRHAATLLGTLALSRTMPSNGNLSLNYTYRYDPLLSQYSVSSSAYGVPLRTNTDQRLALSYSSSPLPRLNLSLWASYGLPLQDNSLFGSISYRLNRNWAFAFTTSQDRYGIYSYRDTEFSVARRFFGRDIIFAYSTQTKKLRFDLASSSY